MTTMRVVGECFFWYRLTRVFPDKFHRAVKRLCVVCVCVFRVFLERVIYDTMMEIRQSGTFQALTDAVNKEKEEKSNMEGIIRK